MCIYIYICCRVKNWSKSSVKNWSKFFSHVLGILKTQIVSHCAKIVFLQKFGDVKNEVFEKKIAFFVFVLFMFEKKEQKKEKKENGKAKRPYKNRFFKVVMQKCEKSKMWNIKRNGFIAKIAWHYLCQEGRKNAHFRARYLFWPTIFLGPKQCKPGKTIKIVVSAEIAQTKNDTFFGKKVFFWHGWKSGFY